MIFRFYIFTMTILTSECTKFNLREPILQKFPGGMPPDPQNLACFDTTMCISNLALGLEITQMLLI